MKIEGRGLPRPAGPFGTLCIPGDLRESLCPFGCMARAEALRSQRKTNLIAAGIPPKTANGREKAQKAQRGQPQPK